MHTPLGKTVVNRQLQYGMIMCNNGSKIKGWGTKDSLFLGVLQVIFEMGFED